MDSSWPYLNHDVYGLTLSQQKWLANNRFIYEEDICYWFCDACATYHEFENDNGILYKTCLSLSHIRGPETSEEDRRTLWFNLPKLTEVIVDANLLQKKQVPTQPEAGWFVGFCSQYVLWLTQYTHFEAINAAVSVYKSMVPDIDIVLITLMDLAFLPDEQTLLKTKGVSLISLSSLANSEWRLPLTSTEPNARLVIDRQAISIRVDGQSIQMENRLFKTALLIAEAAPNALKSEDYDMRYYGYQHVKGDKANTPLTQAVSELRALFKKNGFDPAFQLKAKNQGYIVNPAYSVQIL
jgi:DNA-binding winged helix-turn-helix (wHTH) protein